MRSRNIDSRNQGEHSSVAAATRLLYSWRPSLYAFDLCAEPVVSLKGGFAVVMAGPFNAIAETCVALLDAAC